MHVYIVHNKFNTNMISYKYILTKMINIIILKQV